jgi:hypothetical protein
VAEELGEKLAVGAGLGGEAGGAARACGRAANRRCSCVVGAARLCPATGTAGSGGQRARGAQVRGALQRQALPTRSSCVAPCCPAVGAPRCGRGVCMHTCRSGAHRRHLEGGVGQRGGRHRAQPRRRHCIRKFLPEEGHRRP